MTRSRSAFRIGRNILLGELRALAATVLVYRVCGWIAAVMEPSLPALMSGGMVGRSESATSGAKALGFCDSYGTAEAVPLARRPFRHPFIARGEGRPWRGCVSAG